MWKGIETKIAIHVATVLLILFNGQTGLGSDADTILVRLFPENRAQERLIDSLRLDAVSEIPSPRLVDALISPSQLAQVEALGIRTKVLLDAEEVKKAASLTKTNIPIDPVFHTYEELEAELDALANAYPQITMLDTIGHSQQEGRIIWAFKISDNVHVEEDEPAVLYDGVHHACEVMGLEICMHMISHLLNNYGSDQTVTDWVNTTEIWFVPLLNPDGHSAVTSGHSLFWRKNGRELDDNGILYEYQCNYWWTCRTEGVNINRNYDFNWEHGSGNDSWNHDYRGETPFSESENQALRELARRQQFVFSVSYHSYGEIVYYPWSWDGSPAPDDAVISSTASHMASLIPKDDGFTYDYGPNDASTGMSSNWLYGALGTIDFMIEVNPYPTFIPEAEEIADIAQRNMNGAFYLLERVKGPGLTGRITSADTGSPLSATVTVLEMTSSEITPRTSEANSGRYYRMLLPGSYTVEVSKEEYQTRLIQNVTVKTNGLTGLDVSLQPLMHLSFSGAAVDDDSAGGSRGDDDGLPDPGETVEIFVTIMNSGNHAAHDISVSLTSQDTFVSVAEERREFGSIPAGTAVVSPTAFIIDVDSLCPVPTKAQFRLDIEARGNLYSSTAFFLAIGQVEAGDVNLDGSIDILDVLLAVNGILGLAELSSSQYSAADITNDGVIDILDVVRIVNMILA